jgi:hypothetical protein
VTEWLQNPYFWAQAIGVVAFLISTFKYQLKCQRQVMWAECPATYLWALHTFMLGGVTGAIANLIGATRGVLCLTLPERYIIRILLICFSLSAILIISQAQTINDVLPLFASVTYGCGLMFQKQGAMARIFFLCGDIIWLVYACLIGSVPLAATCALSSASGVIGLYRYEKEALAMMIQRAVYRTYP